MEAKLVHRIRVWLTLFTVGLVLSGLTAFPLETELRWLVSLLQTAALSPVTRQRICCLG